MINIINKNLKKLIELCKKYRVKKIYLFGSAVADNFSPEKSDLDFLVVFDSMSCQEHADAFFSLQEELEILFNTTVDLIEEKPIRNPYFREEIEQTRVELYAA